MDLKYYAYIKNSRESYAGQLKVFLANLLTSSESIQNPTKASKPSKSRLLSVFSPHPPKQTYKRRALLSFQVKD